MYFSKKLEKAINFAIKVHQVDRAQKRKGKAIPYIIHPLSVGLILSRVGADEDLVIAGILHDTIEDSKDPNKITRNIIAEKFGEKVANIVNDLTEQDKTLPWAVRKKIALEHVKHMQKDSLLVKSADVLHNLSDLNEDLKLKGLSSFEVFNATQEQVVSRYKNLIPELEKAWKNNPLINELKIELKRLILFCTPGV